MTRARDLSKLMNDGAISSAQIAAMASSKLTGAMPALDGSALTGVNNMVHIKTQTGSNVSSIDFLHGSNDVVFDNTYNIYELIVHYFYTASGHELRINPSSDGSGFTTTNTMGYVVAGYANPGANSWNTTLGSNGFFRSTVSGGDTAAEGMAGSTRVYSPYDSDKNTVAMSVYGGMQSTSVYYANVVYGGMTGAGRTHGLQVKSEVSNIYAKVSLYGIKDS